MQICVAKLLTTAEPQTSTEAVETGWMKIEEVLEGERKGKIRLAPPQWFMLHELIHKHPKEDDFVNTVINNKTDWPSFIQPCLIPFGKRWLWCVRNTAGEEVRVQMDREGDSRSGYFYNFLLLSV